MTHFRQFSRVLAHNLKMARLERGYTQAEVAAKAKLSIRQVHKIENTGDNPTLETLCRLAAVFGITIDELLRLKRIRTRRTAEEYLNCFREQFEREPVGAGIRTLTGVVLWGNGATKRLGVHQDEDQTISLMEIMKGPALEILRTQLLCEQKGLVTPYTNFTTDRLTGDRTFTRYYPTLIFPEIGTVPYFAALYIAAPEEDCHMNYFRFCDRLLRVGD